MDGEQAIFGCFLSGGRVPTIGRPTNFNSGLLPALASLVPVRPRAGCAVL